MIAPMDEYPFTRENLDQVVPSTWVHCSELIPRRYQTTRKLNKVHIAKTQMTVPGDVWERLGAPSRCSIYFDRRNMLVVPSDEILVVRQNTGYAVLWRLCAQAKVFAQFLKIGKYKKDQFRIVGKAGLRVLEVDDCTQIPITRSAIAHWREAIDRFENK